MGTQTVQFADIEIEHGVRLSQDLSSLFMARTLTCMPQTHAKHHTMGFIRASPNKISTLHISCRAYSEYVAMIKILASESKACVSVCVCVGGGGCMCVGIECVMTSE